MNLEQRITELEKRLAELEGQVQAQPVKIELTLNQITNCEEIMRKILSGLQKVSFDL